MIPRDVAPSGTRAEFVAAARRLFAERGFYGASIAAIASELGLTKQALIHHFGTKEKLYGEVLADMAEGLAGVVERARASHADPSRQLEALLLAVYQGLFDRLENTQLMMRELLDNRARAEKARSWYMRDFLDALVAMVRKSARLSETEALARIYLILGAMNYFAISQPTLRQMYGKTGSAALKEQAPDEIRRLIQNFVLVPSPRERGEG